MATSTAPFVGRSLIKTCRNVPIGAEIHGFWKSKSYLKKLIVAPDDPEPSTAMPAVWLLQQLGDRRAVEPLKRLADKTQDIYLHRAALRTLDELEIRYDRRDR